MEHEIGMEEETLSRNRKDLLIRMGVLYQLGERTRVNQFAFYPDPIKLHLLAGQLIVELGLKESVVVVAPEGPSYCLAQAIAFTLSEVWHKDSRALYATQVESGLYYLPLLYRDLIAEQQVVVVKDVLKHGSEVGQVLAAVKQAGGTISAVGCLINTIGEAEAANLFAETKFGTLLNL